MELTELKACIRGAVTLFWLAGWEFTMGFCEGADRFIWESPIDVIVNLLAWLFVIPFWPLFLGIELGQLLK